MESGRHHLNERIGRTAIRFCALCLLAVVACGRFSPPDSRLSAEADSGPGAESGVDSGSGTGDSLPATDSGDPFDTDTGTVELSGESFACGDWETGSAPLGHVRLRDADLVLDRSYLSGLIGALGAATLLFAI